MESGVPGFAGLPADALHAAHEPAGLPLWPPRARGVGWRVSAARGTVAAVWPVGAAGDPATLAVVDLDDGPRLTSRVVGGAATAGLRVRLAWDGDVPVFVADAPTGQAA